MNLYEEIELQEMQKAVDSLATENQMLQEMKTPTKEQINEIIREMPNRYTNFFVWDMSTEIIEFIITEWEKLRNGKQLRLEIGKTYITKDGSEVKIIYKSPVRGIGFLGIRATDGKTRPDDAIWYNPDGSHNEKYDCLTIIKLK